MNECASQNGLRTVRQKMCSSLEEAIQFARDLGVAPASIAGDVEHKSSSVVSSSSSSSSFENQVEIPPTENLNTGRLGRASNLPHYDDHVGDENGINSKTFCVIKPTRGVASDDVQFCSNLDEVKTAFEKVHGTSVFGSITGERHDSVVSTCNCIML